MIVTRDKFFEVVEQLRLEPSLGLDTETYGLRMYHGDRIFSIILATGVEAFYFNFKDDPGYAPSQYVLGAEEIQTLDQELFRDPSKLWYIQKAANFDLPHLKRWDIELCGDVHCTLAMGRVVYNDRMGFSLEEQLPLVQVNGEVLFKDQTVDTYIEENKLFTHEVIPGKVQRSKNLHFDKVPFDIMAPYGESDGTNVFHLGKYQEKKIQELDAEQPALVQSGRSLNNVLVNEKRLVKTIFRMKDYGVRIDRSYCEKAIAYELDRAEKATAKFQAEAGVPYKDSSKVFEQVFASERASWGVTKKGNPSFDADAIARLKHPAAKAILAMRDAKSRANFYNGFLYHADSKGNLHPNYNSEGTTHGRFSSSEPNFQNLTAEPVAECRACGEEIETVETSCPKCKSTDLNQFEFTVRRAIIPRDGFVFIMPDYDQMEYKFALEMACRVKNELTPFGQMIKDGYDFHDATGARVKEVAHLTFSRKVIKTANFLTLYGGGAKKLAEALGIKMREAQIIRHAIMNAAPEINGESGYINTIMRIAEERKYIVNWFGRRSHFPFKHFSYKAPNYHVSGGCADVVKIAMNRIDEYLLTKKSKMVMTVHDELPIEIHESELEEVPKVIKEIMEGVFPAQYIPLTTGMEFSTKSLGDKKKGFPK